MKANVPNDRARMWAYVGVAIVALLIGIILGQLSCEPPAGGSRIDWPKPSEIQPR